MRSNHAFSGEQLRFARLAHGYSLDDLGRHVGATRQYVHQLEVGAKIPTNDMRATLAKTLGVREHFFNLHNRSTVRPEQCHFRKRATTPATVASQVLARGTLLDVFVGTMEGELDLPEVAFPEFSIDSIEDVERAAEGARAFWNLEQGGPITSMTRVAENAGAIVSYFGGVSDRVDALSMDRRRPFILRSEAKPSACRLRFDIAHECGHLIMHRGVLTGDKETEAQANRFASAFLLPRSAFLAEFPRSRFLDWTTIFDLKLRWKVSARAIIRRAYDLGIITSDQYRTGNIHLVKTGQSKSERFDGIIKSEAPELLESAFETLEASNAGAVGALAERVGLDEAMFEVILGRPLPTPAPRHEGPNIYQLFG